MLAIADEVIEKLFAVRQLTVANGRVGSIAIGAASCRSSHVRNAPLATVGQEKATCREEPQADMLCGRILSRLAIWRRSCWPVAERASHFEAVTHIKRK